MKTKEITQIVLFTLFITATLYGLQSTDENINQIRVKILFNLLRKELSQS